MGDFPRVGLAHTEERRLVSRLTGTEYQLAILLPESYSTTRQRYPVIYLLDGDILFGMAANFMPTLQVGEKIPEHIVVGIGYDLPDNDQFYHQRELDFKIPEVQADPPGSHADRFLAALKEEIIPFIESSYHAVSGERTLFGFSSSGFFALYALCNEPGLFRRYLVASGDLDIAFPYILAHDQKLAARAPDAPIDLSLTIGGAEEKFDSSQAAFHGLVEAIQARAYPGLRLMTDTIPGEDHNILNATQSFVYGLRKCFAAKS